MARFRDSMNDQADEGGIDISPMIDCVFILLIFFIVTTTFVEESGVQVDKPQPAPVSVMKDKPNVVIRLTASGQVFNEGSEIGIGGVQTLVKTALRQEDVPVIIQSESKAQTGMLVRVIDEARLAGASKISLATARTKR